MINKSRIDSINNCSGCGLCSFICPKNVIILSDDLNRDHFIYPTIDYDACVNCGLCFSKCPANNKEYIKLNHQSVFYFKMENETNLLKSSSGGAFQTIATRFLSNGNAAVYGAAWDDELTVSHIRVTELETLNKLYGSKYIQSKITKDIYKSILIDLKNGMNVLFSGTPCQVAAVSTLVEDKTLRENLFLIEILCHGVPNEWAFKKCIEYENNYIEGKIIKFDFRYKHSGAKDNRKFRYIYIKNNSYYETIADNYYFPFYSSFHDYSNFRESCYKCDYRENRFGDLILGDFWNIQLLDENISTDYNSSLVIPLSIKGEKLLPKECKLVSVPLKKLDNDSLFNDSEYSATYHELYKKINSYKNYKMLKNKTRLLKQKNFFKNFVKFVLNYFGLRKKYKYTSVSYSNKKLDMKK